MTEKEKKNLTVDIIDKWLVDNIRQKQTSLFKLNFTD